MNRSILKTAFRQVYAEQVALADGEKDGARWSKALLKAFIEIEENDSIRFENKVLVFRSRTSGEKRIVTAFGCHKTFCPCGNAPSYHAGIYKILTRYFQLMPKSHLQTRTDRHGATIIECLECLANNRVDFGHYQAAATDKFKKSEMARMEREHKSCGERFKKLNQSPLRVIEPEDEVYPVIYKDAA